MPIEITELVVRARVNSQDEESTPNNTSAGANSPTLAADPGAGPQVQLLEKAVEEALNLIKRKNER